MGKLGAIESTKTNCQHRAFRLPVMCTLLNVSFTLLKSEVCHESLCSGTSVSCAQTCQGHHQAQGQHDACDRVCITAALAWEAAGTGGHAWQPHSDEPAWREASHAVPKQRKNGQRHSRCRGTGRQDQRVGLIRSPPPTSTLQKARRARWARPSYGRQAGTAQSRLARWA